MGLCDYGLKLAFCAANGGSVVGVNRVLNAVLIGIGEVCKYVNLSRVLEIKRNTELAVSVDRLRLLLTRSVGGIAELVCSVNKAAANVGEVVGNRAFHKEGPI